MPLEILLSGMALQNLNYASIPKLKHVRVC